MSSEEKKRSRDQIKNKRKHRETSSLSDQTPERVAKRHKKHKKWKSEKEESEQSSRNYDDFDLPGRSDVSCDAVEAKDKKKKSSHKHKRNEKRKERSESVESKGVKRSRKKEKSKSKENEENYNRPKIRGRSKEKEGYSRSKKRSKSLEKEDYSRSRNRSRSKEKEDFSRSRNRSKSIEKDYYNRSRNRSKSIEKDYYNRSRNRSKSIEKDYYSRSRNRSRGKEGNYYGRSRSRSNEKRQDVHGRSKYKRSGSCEEEQIHKRTKNRRSRSNENQDIHVRSRSRRSRSRENRYFGRSKHNDASDTNDKQKTSDEQEDDAKARKFTSQKRTGDLLTSRTGGAYIPPAKLKLMQANITDKASAAYQRIAWEALKKSIQGYINKVNTSNIGLITRELLRENIIRGRGLLARSIIQAQTTSPTFTSVYAALTAVINSKFAQVGELIVNRLAIQFKRAYRTNNKALCITTTSFIAHLVNQSVAHEILVLEILTLLVENPTNDSIEVAIALLKECGMRLTEITKKCVESIFETLRNILHEGQLDRRIQYMIEVMFQIRKDGFKDYEAVPEELDLVEEDNQITHLVNLIDAKNTQDILNVFKFDPEYEQNEEKYKEIIKEILFSDSEEEDDDDDDDEEEDDSSEEDEEKTDEKKEAIVDMTGTNLTALRRTIYLTIQSSLDFEECAHKLLKMKLLPGQEIEFCHMFLDCCAEMRTYDKFYGQLAGRFCDINKVYRTCFEKIFSDSYDTIHRLDTNKLRNVSKFFAHLLFTDSMSWEVLSCVKLNEDDSSSSGRIFLKILFQELNEYMGLTNLNERVKDVTLQTAFAGIFPRDNPRDTRFTINFFTAIGLGGLTDDLRDHLASKPKPKPIPQIEEEDSSSSDSSSSSSSTSSSSDTSDSET